MPAILIIVYSERPDLLSHETCKVQIYIAKNCTSSTASSNVIYFIHILLPSCKTAYYRKFHVSLGLHNVNIAVDWLAWRTPHSAPVVPQFLTE